MRKTSAATVRAAMATTTLIALVAILPTACSDSLGPTGSSVGEVAFHYEGMDSGNFTARGARSAGGGTHAAGLWHGSPAVIRVYSIVFTGQGLADQFTVHAYGSEAGTYTFDEEAGPIQSGTAYAELALDVRKDQNTARAIYVLTSGTVTFEPLEDGRIQGHFEGTARELNGTATIQIDDGHFDVPNNLDPPV